MTIAALASHSACHPNAIACAPASIITTEPSGRCAANIASTCSRCFGAVTVRNSRGTASDAASDPQPSSTRVAIRTAPLSANAPARLPMPATVSPAIKVVRALMSELRMPAGKPAMAPSTP